MQQVIVIYARTSGLDVKYGTGWIHFMNLCHWINNIAF